ncbi:MAG: hypothetical protein GC162_09165 [Planctomycetes bacterium]|nr:hypothetical protein [Planctomycetota bacterium]
MTVTTKQKFQQVIDQLPDNATARQIVEAIAIRLELDEGIRQIEAGESLTMADFEREFAQWLK